MAYKKGDPIKTVTDEMREGMRKFAEETLGWKVSKKKIKAIWVYPKGRYDDIGKLKIEVGKLIDSRMTDTPNENVMAIFESNAYLVCTFNRGGARGAPYLYGKEEVFEIEEFK